MAFQMPSFLSRFMRPFTTSTSLSLQPDALAARNFPETTQRATVAAGCFWGVEHLYRKKFGNGKGLLDARVGYTGGGTDAPNYRSVCSGKTGHAESLLILFDPEKVSYRQLLEFFWKTHDPTTKDQQGMDRGSQYRSAVFANSEEQLKIAQELKEKVGKEWYPGKPITTEVAIAGPWFDAEDYHQLYLENNPHGYECPMHYERNFKSLSS
jgi:peptide-methionine (S)-S-oxide reductase